MLQFFAFTRLFDLLGSFSCYVYWRFVVLKTLTGFVKTVRIHCFSVTISKLGSCRMFHRYIPSKAPRRFGIFIYTPVCEVLRLHYIQLITITSRETELLEFGGASGSDGGYQVVLVGLPMLDDLPLLFKKDARWTKAVRAAKPESETKWRLLRDELIGLQITVLADGQRLVKIWREVIEKNKLLVEEQEALQRMVSDKRADRQEVEK